MRVNDVSIVRTKATPPLGGALNCVHEVQPYFKASGFGRIITIGNNLVQNPVAPHHDDTAATNALLAFTRKAAREPGSLRVAVKMVSGGLRSTMDASAARPEAMFDLIAGAIPKCCVTTPDYLANAAMLFFSPWSSIVSRQNLIVGGRRVFG